MNRGKVTALVGAQFGSEGKGVVAHYLANEYEVAIRTGGPNAGHSIVFDEKLYKMQSIPCGWVNKGCILVIGPGAVVSPRVLLQEVEEIAKVMPDIRDRLFIDAAATILEDRHHAEEGGIHGEMHRTMGSTGEGVGAARRDRIARDPARFRMARDASELSGLLVVEDTAQMVLAANDKGSSVLLEGTQGCGLSLIHGYWPHVTSQDTNAAQLAADAGLPPQRVTDTVLVARTYPIRVAGPSGPLKGEKSWENLSVQIGRKVVEHTTVTKKIRRVGEWDEVLFAKALRINEPSWIALTFADYLDSEDLDKTSFDELGEKVKVFVNYIERTFRVWVRLIGTGFDPAKGWSCVDRTRDWKHQ